MSVISTALKHMLAAGMDPEVIVAAVADMEQAQEPKLTARQERNRRYYENKKASEKRLNKTDQDNSDVCGKSAKEKSPHTPLKENNPPIVPPRGSALTAPNCSKPAKGFGKATAPKPDDVSEQVWSDFLAIRTKKRAPLTATALAGIIREAGKAGCTLEQALALSCERGWQGFNADWIKPGDVRRGPSKPEQSSEPMMTINLTSFRVSHVHKMLVSHFSGDGRWRYQTQLGPAPDHPRCEIPEHMIKRAMLEAGQQSPHKIVTA